MPEMVYSEPRSLEEAVSTLQQYGDEAKVLAGGQSLLVMLRNRLVSPECLVSIEHIPNLNGVELDNGAGLRIGAATIKRLVETSPLVRQHYQVLAQASSKAGPLHVRNRGTTTGSVCHNELGSDEPAALLSLYAKAVIHGPKGSRTVALEEFFVDLLTTIIQPDEIVTHLLIPPAPQHSGSAYVKHTVRNVDRALVGVAAVIALDPSTGACKDVRLGVGGNNPVPFRPGEAEEMLKGQQPSSSLFEEAGEAVARTADPVSDAFASAEYRKRVTPVIVRRALEQASQAAKETLP